MLLLDDGGKLGELKRPGVKLPSRCSIVSRPGLFEQLPRLSPCRFKSGTAISRPSLLA